MRRGLAGIGKVAIAIEINESADTCRACTEVGRVDAHRLCTELHIGEIRHDHAVFIVAEQIIAIGIHARLAIGFIVDARTHEQAGHDVMHRSAIRNQGLVVAGANSGTGIGQVTEINATHTDHVILDFAITGQAADHAVTGGIRAQAEAREGRTAWRIQRLGERQLEHDVRAAARNRDRTDLDAWSEIAVLVEIDESAKPGINSGQVGRGDVHRAGLADNEHQAGGVDAILIVAGRGIITAGRHQGLTIRFGIDQAAHEQTGDDRMRGTAIGQQRLVVAGTGACAGIGQVAEIGGARAEGVILHFTIRCRAGRRAGRRGAQTEACITGRHRSRRCHAEAQRNARVVAAVWHAGGCRFAGVVKIAVTIEIDETAQGRRAAHGIGGEHGNIDRSAGEERQRSWIDRILVVIRHRAGTVGQRSRRQIVSIRADARLTVDFRVHAGTEAQARAQRMARPIVDEQGCVIAGAGTGASIGQVAEINRGLYFGHVILDLAVAGRAGRRTGRAGIRTDAETRIGRSGEPRRHRTEYKRCRSAAVIDIDAGRFARTERTVAVVIDEAADACRGRVRYRIVVGDPDIPRSADILRQVGDVDAILVIRRAIGVITIGTHAGLAVDLGINRGTQAQRVDDRMHRAIAGDQGTEGIRQVAEIGRLHEAEIDAVVRGRIRKYRIAVVVVIDAADAQAFIGRLGSGRRRTRDRPQRNQARRDRVRIVATGGRPEQRTVVVVVDIEIRIVLVGYGGQQAEQGRLRGGIGDGHVVIVAGEQVAERILAGIAEHGCGQRRGDQAVAAARSGRAVVVATQQHADGIDARFARVGQTIVALGRIARAIVEPDQIAEAVTLGQDHADFRRFCGGQQVIGRGRAGLEHAMRKRVPARIENRRVAADVRRRATDIARRRTGRRRTHRNIDFNVGTWYPIRARDRIGQGRERTNAEPGSQ